MQKLFIVLTLTFLFHSSVISQNKNSISGSIIDSVTKKPVEYATITLFNIKTNKAINGSTTDSLGYFKLTDVDSGAYNISFESIGYTQKLINNFGVKESRILQPVGTIYLHKSDNTLQDVVVTSEKKLVDNRIDKIVFNAENDVTSQGGVANDILKKVPQVSIDADGNVELAGSGGVRFLINGKPSTAFGSNVADVLQSIPASEIKSIEVITNPGAKYDAQGMAGIINIILKKSTVSGVNGNVSLTAGTRSENGSFNITMRNGNFGLNAFVSGNARLTAKTPNVSDRTTIDSIEKETTLFHQQSQPQTNRYGVQAGFGFDWTINKYNNLSGNINHNRFGNNSMGLVNQEQKTAAFNSSTYNTDLLSTNNYNNKFLFYSDDLSLNYKKTFKKEDQSLEINVNSSLGNNNSKGNNFQTLLPQDSVYYGIDNNNEGYENETEFEINYEQPFTDKINFGTGADFTFNDIKSNSTVFSLDPVNR